MEFGMNLGRFVRWALTWPLLVIVALNLENAAAQAGYSTIIQQHWRDASLMLNEIYSYATSPWIWYPTIFLLGATVYEWVTHTIDKMERDGSGFQKWLLKSKADLVAPAFSKAGLSRKTITADKEIALLNRRLSAFALPIVPMDFEASEAVNQCYGSYLVLISKGSFEHAKAFIQSQAALLQSHEGTEVETQP
jgi:hypothetical protein